MSFYNKRIVILKQIEKGYSNCDRAVTGLVTIEKSGADCLLTVSAINLKFGSYKVIITNSKMVKFFEMTKAQIKEILPEEFSIEKGACCLIYALDNNNRIPVLYGLSGDINISLYEILNKGEENFETKKKTETKKPEVASSEKSLDKQESVLDNLSGIYLDEVVATENYFEKENINLNKIVTYGSYNGERIPDYDTYRYGIHWEKRYSENQQRQETEKETEKLIVTQSKSDFDSINEEKYYDKVKLDLDKLFNTYEKEEALTLLIPNSKWVKVKYGLNKYYTVGIIYKNNLPRYICYGVPCVYSETPPAELKGYCRYLPIDIFKPKERGYWMMYQDAVTGKSLLKCFDQT